MADQVVHIGHVYKAVRRMIRKEWEGGARRAGEELHVLMRAGAAGGAATVIDDHVVARLLTLSFTSLSRRVMAKTSKDAARGSHVGEGEGRALAVEGASGDQEVRGAPNWEGVEDQVVGRGNSSDV